MEPERKTLVSARDRKKQNTFLHAFWVNCMLLYDYGTCGYNFVQTGKQPVDRSIKQQYNIYRNDLSPRNESDMWIVICHVVLTSIVRGEHCLRECVRMHVWSCFISLMCVSDPELAIL